MVVMDAMRGWVRVTVVAGSVLLLAGTAATWLLADLETAGWAAGVAGAVIGAAGLVLAAWNGGGDSRGSELTVSGTGDATARDGGTATSGVTAPADRPFSAEVRDSGDAEADGTGSAANTGITLT